MKITFLYKSYESLAVEYLSAMCKNKGYDTELVFDPSLFHDSVVQAKRLDKLFKKRFEKLANKVVLGKPDIIAFSVVTDDYQWALHLSHLLKKRNENIPIIFGGIHPTGIPQKVIEEKVIDFICVGEGEQAILDVLENLESGEIYKDSIEQTFRSENPIENIWYKKDGEIIKNHPRQILENIDLLPFPDKKIFYDLIPAFKEPYVTMTSRGCPFNCSYCSNNILRNLYKDKGSILRRRSVENVLEELKTARQEWHFSMVNFTDDLFTDDEKWLEEFILKYKKEIGLPFVCHSHPKKMNCDMAKLLAYGGCKFIEMGVQSYDETIRRKVLFRPGTNEEIINSIKAIKESGITLKVDHIVGIPGQTLDELDRALKLYKETNVDFIDVFWLTYYPGAAIAQIALEKGHITETVISNSETGLADSDMHGGGVIDRRKFYPFRFWAGYLPHIPNFMVRIILSNQKLKTFYIPSLFLSVVLPLVLSGIKGRCRWLVKRHISGYWGRILYFLKLYFTV